VSFKVKANHVEAKACAAQLKLSIQYNKL